MNGRQAGLAATAPDLRREFDRSFAHGVAERADRLEDLLAIRIAGEAYALRLAEVRGLSVGRPVVPLPRPGPALMGLAGVRGAIVPVYDLARLLGCPPVAASPWLALAAGAPVGFAFEAFEGQLRLPREAIVEAEGEGWARRQVREIARAADLARPVVHLPSVLADIERATRQNLPA